MVEIRDADQCHQMKHGIKTFHRNTHTMRISNIPGEGLKLVSNILGARRQVDEAGALLPPSTPIARARSAGARHRLPFDERTCSEHAVVSRSQQMSTDPEEIFKVNNRLRH